MWLEKVAELLERVVNPVNRAINGVGIGILAVMMFLTTADVCGRSLNRPILGAFELTEFMMVVVVFLTIAYAAVLKGHISVDVVVERLSPRARAIVDTITISLSLSLFSLLVWRGFIYTDNIRIHEYLTSALFVPIYPFASLVAIGSILLCLVLLTNLLRSLSTVVSNYQHGWLGVLLVLVPISLVFTFPVWQAHLPWELSPMTMGYIGVGLLLLLLFTGMPIGFVMGLVGFLGLVIAGGVDMAFERIGATPYSTAASYDMSVVPLFVLMGAICFFSGLSRDLYYTAYKWLGQLRGGLAMATVGACAAFAAVSGSSIATAATMGKVALPEMARYKYDPALATGSVAAGGTIGILIPPSVILVLYGILTEQSIGRLFLAGFIPGVLEAVFYMITIYILCKRNPLMGPRGPRTSFTEKVAVLKNTWGVLALFVLVMGGLYTGIFTPTEAAGVGAFGALLFALVRRKLTGRGFVDSLVDAGKITAMTFMILIGAQIFNYFLAVSRLPFEAATLIAELGVNRYIIFGIILLGYLLMGCVISALGMIILTVPILFPLITALGFDPIWFGIIIVRVVEMAGITPPYGINVFVIKGVAKDIPIYTIFRGIIPFLIADLIEVALLVAVPQIALFLPSLLK